MTVTTRSSLRKGESKPTLTTPTIDRLDYWRDAQHTDVRVVRSAPPHIVGRMAGTSRLGPLPAHSAASIDHLLPRHARNKAFDCPNCAAEYKLVRAEAGPPPDHQIECRRCGAPLQGREGKFILKYFLIGRGRTQAKAARGG